MRTSIEKGALERRVTGQKCEVSGCYGLATWLITFDGDTSHWCSKHTRIRMREPGRWGGKLRTKIEA